MTILYDLRKDQNNALVKIANENLRKYSPELLDKFGEIGSSEWWNNFDTGRITKKIITGNIISIEPDEDDDLGDAVTIQTSERKIAYDYEGYWKKTDVKIGAIVKIIRIKSTVSTRTGPISILIDAIIEVNNC